MIALGLFNFLKKGNDRDREIEELDRWLYDDDYFDFDDDEDEEDDYYDSASHLYDDVPEGCIACGGPYPDCTSSCSLFDD